MKSLYEIVNGWMGESYVRVYAWADSPERALELAREQYGPERSRNLEVWKLVEEGQDEFCTPASDCGFPWHEVYG